MKPLLSTLFALGFAVSLQAAEDPWHGAGWIGCDRPLTTPDLAPEDLMGDWITGPQGSSLTGYLGKLELPDTPVVRAMAWWGTGPVAPSAIVVNDGTRFLENFLRKPKRSVDLAFELKPGSNSIEIRFEKARPALPACFGMRVQFADGSDLTFRSGTDWQAIDAKGEALPTNSPGSYAAAGLAPVVAYKDTRLAPAWFRTAVEVGPGLKSATLRHCGLGYGDPFINGTPVSDRVLSPPQTDYEDFAMFETDDVTSLLKEGENALAIQLAPGWFHQIGGFASSFTYGRPRLRAALELNYEDGSTKWVVSDPSWNWKEAEIVESNVYNGEIVDFRRAHREWAAPAGGEGWKSAQAIESPSERLLPVDFPPIRRTREIAPKSIEQVGSKTWLVDFGENISGWLKLPIDEAAGTEIFARYSEMARDGRIWNTPESFWWCHGEPQRDIIIADGKPRVYESRFSYKGFRYAEISGLSKAPDPETLRAVFLHNDCEVVAGFKSSDPLLNRFWDMGLRTHLSNMHGILEDCPHREKCQWGGDLHGSWALGFHALDSAEFYRQQVRLYYTGPMAKGGIPGLTGVGKRLATVQMDFNWGVSPLFLTWRLWTQFGDLATAREFHPQMKHYLEFFAKTDPDGFPSMHKHADHAAPEAEIPRQPQDKELISAINYFAAAERFAELSDALDKPADAKWARELAATIRSAILTRFDKAANSFGNGTQDSLALALEVFRDDPEMEIKVADSLVGFYQKNGHKFDGGFMSYWIYPMLSRFGHTDDALKMLVNADYPGPAWSVKEWDATTFWEKFFTDVPTQFERSLSHHATDHPAAWLLTDLAGIQIDMEKPGGQAILLAPTVPRDLASAEGWMTVKGRGKILSQWKQDGENLRWTATVPDGVAARVDLTGWMNEDGTPPPARLDPGRHDLKLTRVK